MNTAYNPKRQKILHTGKELFWKFGFKRVTIEELCKEAGISKMTYYKYFTNKMDLVNYDQQIYQSIQQEYSQYLAGIGLDPLFYIPVSGREGDCVAKCTSHMTWYDGPTLLEALDSFEKDKPLLHQPLRMPVQDVYKFSHFKFCNDFSYIAGFGYNR